MSRDRDPVAQAAAWDRGRDRGEGYEELARYLVEVTGGRPDRLAPLIRDLAESCRFASAATALNRMLVRWNRRAAGAP